VLVTKRRYRRDLRAEHARRKAVEVRLRSVFLEGSDRIRVLEETVEALTATNARLLIELQRGKDASTGNADT
jgi:hypothetical protein